MSQFMIVLHYGGSWVNSQYAGGQSKTMLVSNKVTYRELVKELQQRIGVTPEEYGLKVQYQYRSNLGECSMMEIVDDEDVVSWVCESLCIQPNKIPLYITLDHNLSRSVHGSIQDTMAASSSQEPTILNSELHNENDIRYENREEDNLPNSGWDNMQFSQDPHASVHVNESQMDESNHNSAHIHSLNDASIPSSSRRRKRKGIQDFDNVALVNTSGDIKVGQLYESKQELKQHLGMLAIRKNYEFKVKRSTTDRFEVVCVDDNCKWRLRAMKLQDLSYFEVRTFHDEHLCSLDFLHRDHRQASSLLIGQYVKQKFEGGVSRIYRPGDIIDDMRVQLGVNMSYNKAWRAKEVALEKARGSPDESFAILPSYCAMLEQKNPGTITHIETNEENHFLYFFMAMGASIRGFHAAMRPVIAIDGTHLKGKYFGTMFVAACQDGENQIYPLAFGVGDSENDASWSWFMTKLREAIGVVENMVFVSDRHGSIAKAVDSKFPEAKHGACIFHIASNLKAKFGKKGKIFKLYYTAAKHYQISEFDKTMEELRKLKDGEVCKYLEDIGCHRWARAHFMGYRYNMMTSNIAESLNAKLKDARKLPITALADHLREMLQLWFVERRDAASSLITHLTTLAEDKVRENYNSGLHMRVTPIDLYAFQIHDQSEKYTVNLSNMTCTCREFDLDRLPCAHAIAACRAKGVSVYSMCSKFYTANALVVAYAEPIWPVGNRSEWNVPENVLNRVVLPPIRVVIPGRRKTVRIPSVGEDPIRNKCTRCGGTGHNRSTCRNPIPLRT